MVRRRGSAVRLNHFSATIRAQSRRKSESEHRQCYHNKFVSHDRLSLLLFPRLNSGMTAKLPKECIAHIVPNGRVDGSSEILDLFAPAHLKLVHFPARSPLPTAALPSMSLFPKAPFDLSVCPSMSLDSRRLHSRAGGYG